MCAVERVEDGVFTSECGLRFVEDGSEVELSYGLVLGHMPELAGFIADALSGASAPEALAVFRQQLQDFALHTPGCVLYDS